jgi:glyoxylase I family protein
VGGLVAAITGGHHIALTVSDLDQSVLWYSDLFGMQVVLEGADDTVRFKVLAHAGSGWILGLRQYAGKGHDIFDETRTGLDHFAFAVSGLAEIQQWESALRQRNVVFSPREETPIGSIIVFRDPDNIQLELWCPPE